MQNPSQTSVPCSGGAAQPVQCGSYPSESPDPSFLPCARQDQICSDSLYFIMNLCDFLLCVVSLDNKNAVHCSTEAEAMILLKVKPGFAIYNSSCSTAGALARSHVIRECNRVCNAVCCWNEGHLFPMVEETSRKNAKKVKPSTPVSLPLPSILRMNTAAKTTLPAIVFNFAPNGRRSVVQFETSCLFAGSRIDGRLIARFVHCLDASNAVESFSQFISAEQSVSIFDDPFGEPYFAGFFLHESQFSFPLFDELKQLYCKIAPVFVHLSRTCSGRSSAEWWCCTEECCVIQFVSQTPGWVVNFQSEEPSASCQSGFDVFFKPGLDSGPVVDAETLKEVRMPRILGVFTDARKREDTVPFCNSLLKDVKKRIPSLLTEDLPLVDKNVVWSFMDVGAREFVHVVALLSRAQYHDLKPKQKCSYLYALTWIFSRTGAAFATKYILSGNVFAVRTACCFILDQMTQIRASDVPKGLKQWYTDKDVPLANVPDIPLLNSLFQNYRAALFVKAQGDRGAHDFPVGGAKMMFSQLHDAASLHKLRASLHVLPTLQFHNASCWMETAVNALFAIPFVRVKLFSFGYPVFNTEICKCLRSLFDIMCVYGPSDCNQVPLLECQRCGVYPIGVTAPPVLGSKGYNDIMVPSEQSWGNLGCAFSTLLRFCASLQLTVLDVAYDPVGTIGTDYQTAVHSGMESDVLLVSVDKAHRLQPSNIVEVISNGFCCAVLFGNGAHHFSVCKAMVGQCWTVKDNIVQEYSTFPTFADALDRAFQLHELKHNYFIHTLVYYRMEMSDEDP